MGSATFGRLFPLPPALLCSRAKEGRRHWPSFAAPVTRTILSPARTGFGYLVQISHSLDLESPFC